MSSFGARRFIPAAAGAVAVIVCALALNSSARADTSQIAAFGATTSTQVAGAHPDLGIRLRVATAEYPPDGSGVAHTGPQQYLRRVAVHLPPGLLANPTSFTTCAEAVVSVAYQRCPDASELGIFQLTYGTPGAFDPTTGAPSAEQLTFPDPIINEVPLPGDVARFAIPFGNSGVVFHINVAIADESDYGVVATVDGIPSALDITEVNLQFWGVPAAATHDSQRLSCSDGNEFIDGCSHVLAGSNTFVVNPTSCPGTPEPVSTAVDFYGDPSTYQAVSDLPPTTGCGALPFAPSLAFGPTTGDAGQPDQFGASLSIPQDDPSDTLVNTTSALRDLSLRLPAGVSLSPGVATGLSACTDAQFNLGVHDDQTCPVSSQLGTVSVTTPYLSSLLTGQVYLGQQESSDPTSGDMYRLFLAADGSGVHLKLIGHVAADPSTGQLTATFARNPQVQFSNLQLLLKGGPRAPLANPDSCGTATSNWTMTSYANPLTPVTGSSSFAVSGNCSLGTRFAPALSAGTASSQAGGSSPFSFTLTRPDGQQVMTGISTVSLPLGLNADIASAQQCATAAAGSCPAGSQVGVASVAAGQGSSPFNLTGQPVYLTGPYKGAPFGLAEVIHAVAGPFDLGTVVVRQALDVDPTTAQVTIHSDPLPTMLGGVPLDLQSISLNINKPGFMRSPTSCLARSITASVQGSPLGAAANVVPGTSIGYATSTSSSVKLSQPMRMGNCQKLAFSPRLAIALAAKNRTKPGDHPRLTATLTQPANQTNLRRAVVSLPLSLALDPNNSEHVCSVKAAAKIACPARTVVGSATAVTRILPHPLSGKVYLVQGIRYDKHGGAHKTEPALLIPLRGADHVAINLRAQTSVDKQSRLVTTFPSIPDAGIARFTLAVTGGKKGILTVTGSKSLCKASRNGLATENGQSNKYHYGTFTMHLGTACRSSKESKH